MRYCNFVILGVVMFSIFLSGKSSAQNTTLQILLEIQDNKPKDSPYGESIQGHSMNTYKNLSLDKYNPEKSKPTLFQSSGSIPDAGFKQQVEENTDKYREFSRKQSERIRDRVRDYLSKRNYTIVEKNGDVIIVIRTPYMIVGSMDGYYFGSVEYEGTVDGKIIFSGIFSQDKNRRDTNSIAKFISKDIYGKLKNFLSTTKK